MKLFFLSIALLLQSHFAQAQIDSFSKSVVFALIQKEQKNDHITYTDRLSKATIKYIDSYLSGNSISGYTFFEAKVILTLTNEDKSILKAQLNKLDTFRWNDTLFLNSVMISVDSMWANISNGNKKMHKIYQTAKESGDTVQMKNIFNERVKFCNTYQFSPPIFLKKKQLVIFYLQRLCGGECGIENLAVYKLENGQYKKWFVIVGGTY